MLHHLFVILNAEPSRQQASKEDLKPAPDSTAVYVGIQHMDYGAALMQHLPTLGVFSATGSPFSVAAGRLSFTFGLKGPAVRLPITYSPSRCVAVNCVTRVACLTELLGPARQDMLFSLGYMSDVGQRDGDLAPYINQLR